MSNLSTHNLSAGYDAAHPVLEHLDMTLEGGHIAVLIGPNGSGKSTLLRTLSGALSPLGGEISIAGRKIDGISRRELARLMAIVTTDATLAGGLTVGETVAIGRHPYTGVFGRQSKSDRAIVAAAMEAAGIAHKARVHLAELSDGERQKVMIARAVAQQTPLLLMDEPTSFLDVGARIDTMALLRRLVDDAPGRTMSVLLSTHDIGPAYAVADDIWAVDPAKHTILTGPKATIASSGILDRPFAGRGIKFDADKGDYFAL